MLGKDCAVEKGHDIVIQDGTIAAVAPDINPGFYNVEKIVDGNNKFVVPGFVNAHLHSHDRFDKGRFDTLPLEIWMSLYNPPLGSRNLTPDECYLRTALNCLDLIKSGTTMVIDDVVHGFPLNRDNIDAVFQAYEESGLRALVSIAYGDRPFPKTIPYLDELLPDNLKLEIANSASASPQQILDLWTEYGKHKRGRVGFFLSPYGPQRCTDEFMAKAWDLSKELDLTVFLHVLETKVQQVTGHLFYGKSILEHMKSIGTLTPKTNLIHMVWVTDSDIKLVADSGASIVYNPASNLKLGSGIAPVEKFLNAGINVSIGTDNNNANDNANMLEAIKFGALVNTMRTFTYEDWLDAGSMIRCATLGGARCAGLESEIGELSPGKKADFSVFRLDTSTFCPANSLLRQLVFCENGESLDMVVVDGKILMEDNKVVSLDERALLEKAMENSDKLMTKIKEASARGKELEPYLRKAYRRCVAEGEQYPAFGGKYYPHAAS